MALIASASEKKSIHSQVTQYTFIATASSKINIITNVNGNLKSKDIINLPIGYIGISQMDATACDGKLLLTVVAEMVNNRRGQYIIQWNGSTWSDPINI